MQETTRTRDKKQKEGKESLREDLKTKGEMQGQSPPYQCRLQVTQRRSAPDPPPDHTFSRTRITPSAGPKEVLFSPLLSGTILGPGPLGCSHSPPLGPVDASFCCSSFSPFCFFFIVFNAFSRFMPTRDPPRDANNAVFAYSCCIFFWRFLFWVRLPVLAYPHTRAS